MPIDDHDLGNLPDQITPGDSDANGATTFVLSRLQAWTGSVWKRVKVGLADLSVVTGASFRVVSPTRGVLTWAAILLAVPTAKLVRLAHVYAAGDLTVAEQLVVTPILTIPGDVVDCVPVLVSVVAY